MTAREGAAVGESIPTPQGTPGTQLASNTSASEAPSAAAATIQNNHGTTSTPAPTVQTKKPGITNILQAKRAYRDARISKDRYREMVRRLEDELDLQIRRAKIDYRDGRISKETYHRRVEILKRTYEGE